MSDFLSFLLIAASAQASISGPEGPVAHHVVEMSEACFELSSGAVNNPLTAPVGRKHEQLVSFLEARDIESGLPRDFEIAEFGAALALISRAGLGSRRAGNSSVVFALGGAVPGCRILAIDAESDTFERIVTTLDRPDSAWTLVESLSLKDEDVQKEGFLRIDKGGSAHLLNVNWVAQLSENVQSWVTVIAVPPGTPLPEDFE